MIPKAHSIVKNLSMDHRLKENLHINKTSSNIKELKIQMNTSFSSKGVDIDTFMRRIVLEDPIYYMNFVAIQ